MSYKVLSVVELSNRLPWPNRRIRGAKRAAAGGLKVCESEDWANSWCLLDVQLETRFDSAPVHTLEGNTLLRRDFPDNIKLHTCVDAGGALQAGVVIYESERVAPIQYIASSDPGRRVRAVDCLFSELRDENYAGKPFFDFGSSEGVNDHGLAAGLIEQKEGFGGRTMVQGVHALEIL
ncbi:MAG: hypothetical protein HOB79_20335 [Rhodospirillaceae bacterium]|jgi:hypothetical protein|nr:hypothetical protein [Rhodospirillaceae bacterium]MBT4703429.1 hypothetical protein [Rhodospirillaceae bacterium]MBT7758851.1 hypothetical protein [Rhodospirillaceae bacterium]